MTSASATPPSADPSVPAGGLPPAHAAFLARALAAVAADPRVEALLAGGSYVHGGMDAQSDLDLVLVVRDEAYDALLAGRRAFAERLGALVGAFGGDHVGEPRLLICLYRDPLLHVDWKIVTADDLDRRVERPAILFARDRAALEARLDAATIGWPDRDADWFEQRVWIWLHYAATKWARGEYYETLGIVAFLRDQILGPMLARRAGLPQRGVRRIEALGLDPEGRLAATLAGHDRTALRAALDAAIALYADLRADAPPAAPAPDMPRALIALMDAAGA